MVAVAVAVVVVRVVVAGTLTPGLPAAAVVLVVAAVMRPRMLQAVAAFDGNAAPETAAGSEPEPAYGSDATTVAA